MTAATVSRAAMPLSAHIREARTRALRGAVALVVGIVVGYIFSGQLLEILRLPVEQLAESRNASLNYDSVTAAFDLKLKIAVFTGIVLSVPVWLGELYGFLAPGLTRREKRYTLGFVLAALPLFAAGCVLGFLLFPHMVELLASFSSAQDSTILNATYYVEFVIKIVLATGVALTLPVFIVLLNFLGVVSARTLRRGWRIATVAIVLFSALVTPAADVLSMLFVALPMAVLFLVAYLVAHLHDRRADRRRDELDPAPIDGDLAEGKVT